MKAKNKRLQEELNLFSNNRREYVDEIKILDLREKFDIIRIEKQNLLEEMKNRDTKISELMELVGIQKSKLDSLKVNIETDLIEIPSKETRDVEVQCILSPSRGEFSELDHKRRMDSLRPRHISKSTSYRTTDFHKDTPTRRSSIDPGDLGSPVPRIRSPRTDSVRFSDIPDLIKEQLFSSTEQLSPSEQSNSAARRARDISPSSIAVNIADEDMEEQEEELQSPNFKVKIPKNDIEVRTTPVAKQPESPSESMKVNISFDELQQDEVGYNTPRMIFSGETYAEENTPTLPAKESTFHMSDEDELPNNEVLSSVFEGIETVVENTSTKHEDISSQAKSTDEDRSTSLFRSSPEAEKPAIPPPPKGKIGTSLSFGEHNPINIPAPPRDFSHTTEEFRTHIPKHSNTQPVFISNPFGSQVISPITETPKPTTPSPDTTNTLSTERTPVIHTDFPSPIQQSTTSQMVPNEQSAVLHSEKHVEDEKVQSIFDTAIHEPAGSEFFENISRSDRTSEQASSNLFYTAPRDLREFLTQDPSSFFSQLDKGDEHEENIHSANPFAFD